MARRFQGWLGRIGIALAVVLIILACSTVPGTGRKQLTLVSDEELVAMSAQEYPKVLESSKLCTNTTIVASVRQVGQRLAVTSEAFLREQNLRTDLYRWEFNVIQDDQTANAWCMPGGKIAFYTGILPYTKDENGIAVVMSHEISHALARHSNERISQEIMAQYGAAALSIATQGQSPATQSVFRMAYGIGANLGVILPYSRRHESEADVLGLTLMARAGYDPRGAVAFWQRMSQVSGGAQPEFLSTHPSAETRIQKIQENLPAAMAEYEKARAKGASKS